MSDKVYSINLDSKNIQHVRISRSKDGYNNASMTCKINDREYMFVDCEWQGDDIPDFAMSVMEHMGGSPNREMSNSDTKLFFKRLSDNFSELAKKGDGDANS